MIAVETSRGVKLPDIVWISNERLQLMPEGAEACSVAPEICVEALSYSNARGEIEEKRRLYFEQGALEVWTCDMKGRMRFFDQAGGRSTLRSPLLPQSSCAGHAFRTVPAEKTVLAADVPIIIIGIVVPR